MDQRFERSKNTWYERTNTGGDFLNSLTEILRSYKECQDKNAFKELDNMIYDYLSQAAIEQKDLLGELLNPIEENIYY